MKKCEIISSRLKLREKRATIVGQKATEGENQASARVILNLAQVCSGKNGCMRRRALQ
jgi:hypothetical protein